MKAVVDTNVIAYLLLRTEPYVGEARTFFTSVAELHAPAQWEAELANVLWMAARDKVVSIEEAIALLTLADKLGIISVPNRTLWHGALARANHSGIALYDALFVELAAREKMPLATFDAALLKTFPAIAVRPEKLVAR